MAIRLSPFDSMAIDMLREASLDVNTDVVCILADDIHAVADELYAAEDDIDAAYLAKATLVEQIGGLRNLHGYMDCLQAGKNRTEP